MTDYEKLLEKYNKKSAKATKLTKENKELKAQNKRLEDRFEAAYDDAYEADEKLSKIMYILGKNYYKVFYECKSSQGFIKKYDETIFACHPRMAVMEIESKEYEDFKLITVEKIG